MQVLVKTDNRLEADTPLLDHVRAEVEEALRYVAEQVTRVEVYLADENSAKSGVDKRCTIEARLAGRAPLAVEHHAEVLHLAIQGAVTKLQRLLERTVERRENARQRTSFSGE